MVAERRTFGKKATYRHASLLFGPTIAMDGRPPPPSYNDTLVRGTVEAGRPFASTGGRPSQGGGGAMGGVGGAGTDFNSHRGGAPTPARRASGVGDAAALEMAKALRSSGVKVFATTTL